MTRADAEADLNSSTPKKNEADEGRGDAVHGTTGGGPYLDARRIK